MVKYSRRFVQWIVALVTNINLKGFFTGEIYTGGSKNLCVPGLNCYSCPGAIGSCPIGSLQAVLGHFKYKFSFYIFGFLILVGTLWGRFVCGYLCPFGLIQELIYKIKSVKFSIARKLVYMKYIILLVFVIGLPLLYTNVVGLGDPAFCKFICPAGTLEAGIPLIIMNEPLQEILGWLFAWKLLLLVVFLVASVFYFRPFCKVICPLGAIYSLFNKISIFRYTFEKEKCINCNLCVTTCKMDVQPHNHVNDIECIRCRECVDVCPTSAITTQFKLGDDNHEKNI